jgi:hypothetical protein
MEAVAPNKPAVSLSSLDGWDDWVPAYALSQKEDVAKVDAFVQQKCPRAFMLLPKASTDSEIMWISNHSTGWLIYNTQWKQWSIKGASSDSRHASDVAKLRVEPWSGPVTIGWLHHQITKHETPLGLSPVRDGRTAPAQEHAWSYGADEYGIRFTYSVKNNTWMLAAAHGVACTQKLVDLYHKLCTLTVSARTQGLQVAFPLPIQRVLESTKAQSTAPTIPAPPVKHEPSPSKYKHDWDKINAARKLLREQVTMAPMIEVLSTATTREAIRVQQKRVEDALALLDDVRPGAIQSHRPDKNDETFTMLLDMLGVQQTAHDELKGVVQELQQNYLNLEARQLQLENPSFYRANKQNEIEESVVLDDAILDYESQPEAERTPPSVEKDAQRPPAS